MKNANHGNVTSEFYERSGVFSCKSILLFFSPDRTHQTHPFLKLSIVIQRQSCDWRRDVIAECG
jgi:hypothetical protein